MPIRLKDRMTNQHIKRKQKRNQTLLLNSNYMLHKDLFIFVVVVFVCVCLCIVYSIAIEQNTIRPIRFAAAPQEELKKKVNSRDQKCITQHQKLDLRQNCSMNKLSAEKLSFS